MDGMVLEIFLFQEDIGLAGTLDRLGLFDRFRANLPDDNL